jgi:glucose/arabinose dehydrogenase
MANRGKTHTLRYRHAAVLSRASCLAVAALVAASSLAVAQANRQHAQTDACEGDNGGIALPPGFCATVFADNIGHARQMAFAPNGALYVNTWSGRYYRNDNPPAGGFLVALKDSKGTGRADIIKRFGDGIAQGSAGGTGIRIYNGGLYAEQNDKIIRYPLPPDGIAPTERPQVILSACR